MVDVTTRRCRHDGCTRYRLFGIVGSRKAEFCALHAAVGVVNVKHVKRCGHKDCPKPPSHGRAGSRKVEFCAQHAAEGMVDVKPKKCRHEEYSTLVPLEIAGGRKGESCGQHTVERAAKVANKQRCSHEGSLNCSSLGLACSMKAEVYPRIPDSVNFERTTCGVGNPPPSPSLGVAGSKNTKACARHGNEEVVDVMSIRIGHEDCSRCRSFAIAGSRKTEFCANVKSNICCHEGCAKSRCHGVADSRNETNAAEEMGCVKGKRCGRHCCSTLPYFGISDSSKGGFCSQHAAEGMVDVKSAECCRESCGAQSLIGVAGNKAGFTAQFLVGIRNGRDDLEGGAKRLSKHEDISCKTRASTAKVLSSRSSTGSLRKLRDISVSPPSASALPNSIGSRIHEHRGGTSTSTTAGESNGAASKRARLLDHTASSGDGVPSCAVEQMKVEVDI